jgi:ParB family transcriptional regulator, chromosome partitioning protein
MAGARRRSLADLASDEVEDVPGASEPLLTHIPVDQIAPTPVNTREDFDGLAELGESIRVRQLQPIVVVPVRRYLALFPEHTKQIGAAAYVLANGQRRWMGVREVELPTIHALIREDSKIVGSRADFLDAVFSENIDRQDFNPIEEARAVAAMVAECGTAELAAERWRKTPGWISQRRALLKLTPELQALVVSGELPAWIGRSKRLAGLPPQEQAAEWEAIKAERAASRVAEDEQPAEAEEASTVPAGTAVGDVDEDQADGDGDAETAEAEVPGPRLPTSKAVGSILSRYRQAYGTEAVAQLVREQLDEDGTVELLTVAARGLSPGHLAKVAAELATLQAAAA